MPTVILPDPVNQIQYRPYVYVKVDNGTSNAKTTRFIANAIVRNVTHGLNEEISKATIELPNTRFGDHVNFGTRIQVFVDNRHDKIFDGYILEEDSTLNENTDSLTVVAYGPQWLLNTQTIVGTYGAAWDGDTYTDANRVVGVKKLVNSTQSGVDNWHNLNEKTVFNEKGIPDMQLVAVDGDDNLGIPLFDKKSPHRKRKKREKEDGTWEDNPLYPKHWQYGYMLKYLCQFHTGDYDVRILNRDVRLLNKVDMYPLNKKHEPKELDVNNTPFWAAVVKIIRAAGPRYSCDVEIVDDGDDTYYRIVIIDFENAIDRDMKIATQDWLQSQGRLNVNSVTIKRNAADVVNKLRGLGNKIEVEMTIPLEEAWDIEELRAYYNLGATHEEAKLTVDKIFYAVQTSGKATDVTSSTEQKASNIGMAALIPGGEKYEEVYIRMKDFFDNKIYRMYRLPSNTLFYRGVLGDTATGEYTFRNIDIRNLFIDDDENKWRKFRAPETPLSTSNWSHQIDADGDTIKRQPQSQEEKYKNPVIFAWDSKRYRFSVIPHQVEYEFEDQAHFNSGTPKTDGDGSTWELSRRVDNISFDIDDEDNVIRFTQPQCCEVEKAEDDKDKIITKEKVSTKTVEPWQDFAHDIGISSKTVFMTAVISTDYRMSPLVEKTFEDFDNAGISVLRYIEDDDYKVVIRNNSLLLHLVEYIKNSDDQYVASSDSKKRAGYPKYTTNTLSNQIIVQHGALTTVDGKKIPRLRIKQDNVGRLELFIDTDTDGDGNINAFIDDYDKLLDLVTERANLRASFTETATFMLDGFDTSYKPGQRIRNIINSRTWGSGFYDRKLIISSVEYDCENYQTTIQAANLQDAG